MTLTDYECKVLEGILASEFHNNLEGRDCVGNAVWTFSALAPLGKEVLPRAVSAGGVVASLSKKGLAIVGRDGKRRNEEWISITQEGYDALMQARKEQV